MRDSGLIQTVPIKDFVAAISVGMVGGQLCLDLTYEEDSRADVDMNVVMTGRSEFIELQGTAEKSPFKKKQMDEFLELAKGGILELIDIQRNLFKDIL
jgi:ribonuclease PH